MQTACWGAWGGGGGRKKRFDMSCRDLIKPVFQHGYDYDEDYDCYHCYDYHCCYHCFPRITTILVVLLLFFVLNMLLL